jgi:single-strand DNA-binding protein
MFDTAITMCGNVLTAPEWRRTANTATYVMTFRFASTSRRFDRSAGAWIDGDSLRVKVACWRTLGQNAFESVQLGDPLVIYGRLYSRDWVDSENNRRTSYELDAISVGHDLSRGVAKFARRRAADMVDTVDDAEGRSALGGAVAELVDPPERPAGLPTADEMFSDFERDRLSARAVVPEGYEEDEIDPDGTDDETDEIEAELSVAA